MYNHLDSIGLRLRNVGGAVLVWHWLHVLLPPSAPGFTSPGPDTIGRVTNDCVVQVGSGPKMPIEHRAVAPNQLGLREVVLREVGEDILAVLPSQDADVDVRAEAEGPKLRTRQKDRAGPLVTAWRNRW